MKKHLFKIITITLSVGLIACLYLIYTKLFYWYEVRPSEIREKCNEEGADKAIEHMKTKSDFDSTYKKYADKDMFLSEDYERAYQRCLRSEGLED